MAILEDTISGGITASGGFTEFVPTVLSDTFSSSGTGGSILSGNLQTSEVVSSSATLTSVLSAVNEMVENAVSTAIASGAMTPQLTQFASIISALLASSALQQHDTPVTWVMNTATKAFSQYDNFSFSSFFTHLGAHYGVTDEGVFLLSGDSDDGADIEAFIMTGRDDLGSPELKGVQYVYLGLRAEGGMTLTAIMGDGTEHTYNVPEALILESKRAILGRGLKARYWQFVLRNVNGGDFDIESMELVQTALERKLNGR